MLRTVSSRTAHDCILLKAVQCCAHLEIHSLVTMPVYHLTDGLATLVERRLSRRNTGSATASQTIRKRLETASLTIMMRLVTAILTIRIRLDTRVGCTILSKRKVNK